MENFPLSSHSKKKRKGAALKGFYHTSATTHFFFSCCQEAEKNPDFNTFLWSQSPAWSKKRLSAEWGAKVWELYRPGCVNSRSHLPRCWECSSFSLGTLIPAKVQTQTSAATKSKSLTDPWVWSSRDQPVPQIQILAQAGRDQTNKTSQQKKSKQENKKNTPKKKSQTWDLLIALSLSFPFAQDASVALSTFPCPTPAFYWHQKIPEGISRQHRSVGCTAPHQSNSTQKFTSLLGLDSESIQCRVFHQPVPHPRAVQKYPPARTGQGGICGKGTQCDVSPICLSNIPPVLKSTLLPS